MRISFLIGPAGCGKTFRCLEEIRSELARDPEGLPLVIIAPKQATYQLERQLLEYGTLRGYTRLRILSFERLARFVFDATRTPLPKVISEHGRVMVLRALLEDCRPHLGIFALCARRLGFAKEFSDQLREFQQLGLTPEHLREMAAGLGGKVAEKLRDLALVYEHYKAWLARRSAEDSDALLSLATERLNSEPGCLRIGGLWFDGFAQLTPEERKLLLAVIACSEHAKLAFCVENEMPIQSALSPWFLVSQTWTRCRAEIETRFGPDSVSTEWLERDPNRSRFARNPRLAQLEREWARPRGAHDEAASDSLQIEVNQCADPEAEAICCAREILRFVRGGGRFREAAVLVRSFENDYPRVLPRVFRKYGIPFFLDHRENVVHHPMAELTRGTLRALAFGWKHTDLFTAFKSGLAHIQNDALDELENEALANGWEGDDWRNGFTFRGDGLRSQSHLDELNQWRQRLIAPILRLERELGAAPSGLSLAAGLRKYWDGLQVPSQLEEWSRDVSESFHSTVNEQMLTWLDNIELAFAQHHLPLRDWLPILEAGLTGLTVGIIPPVLDQVLIGAVDRSRNPDLRIAFVLGANEGVFPAIPGRDQLLSESDRLRLLDLGCELSRIPALQIAAEQFYGYIACTRARERLVITYSSTALDGSLLNPSRFLAHLKRIFPALKTHEWTSAKTIADVEHASELFQFLPFLKELPGESAATAEWRARLNALAAPDPEETLAPEVVQRLYGPELKMAVSSVERFAACPFRFFLDQGLKVRERQEFELDIREQGRFQHEILLHFHRAVHSRGKRWRDLSKADALKLMDEIASEQIERFGGGLFQANEQSRFIGENYKASLQRFIAAVIDWFRANSFDPEQVELPFGYEGDLPGWRVPLENGNALILCGRIDRVDVYRESPGRALCVIMDYKSGMKKPDRSLMEHGIEQQLPGYLLALTQIAEVKKLFEVDELIAAGCFLIPLRSSFETTANRREALDDDSADPAFKHFGFFDHGHIAVLDSEHENGQSGQFQYWINKDGTPRKQGFHAVPTEEFESLLSHTEHLLRSFGKRIYEGDISIRPFKKGTKTACDQCHHQPICRFDPWTQQFNSIRSA